MYVLTPFLLQVYLLITSRRNVIWRLGLSKKKNPNKVISPATFKGEQIWRQVRQGDEINQNAKRNETKIVTWKSQMKTDKIEISLYYSFAEFALNN